MVASGGGGGGVEEGRREKSECTHVYKVIRLPLFALFYYNFFDMINVLL